ARAGGPGRCGVPLRLRRAAGAGEPPVAAPVDATGARAMLRAHQRAAVARRPPASAMLASASFLFLLCMLALLALSACEHGEGGACQNSRDCEDGLTCNMTKSDVNRGVCSVNGPDAGGDEPVDEGPL